MIDEKGTETDSQTETIFYITMPLLLTLYCRYAKLSANKIQRKFFIMDCFAFSIVDLRVDDLPEGMLFVSSPLPSLSWRMIASAPGATQQNYRITAKDADDGDLLWDSGVVESSVSAGIRWGGQRLSSRCRVKWQVRVTDDKGNTAVSNEAFFETPLFENSDWSAKWIWFDGNNPADKKELRF